MMIWYYLSIFHVKPCQSIILYIVSNGIKIGVKTYSLYLISKIHMSIFDDNNIKLLLNLWNFNIATVIFNDKWNW